MKLIIVDDENNKIAELDLSNYNLEETFGCCELGSDIQDIIEENDDD